MIVEPDFLDENQLIELIMLIRKNAGPPAPHNWPEGQCSSLNANLSGLLHPIVNFLELRLIDRLGMKGNHTEELRGVWYREGEGYRLHHDAFFRGTKEWDESVAIRGNRTWTSMVYLNTLTSGGETIFPHLGLRVAPRAGLLIAWRNLTPAGEPDARMMHLATPPVAAAKYIVTQWYRGDAT